MAWRPKLIDHAGDNTEDEIGVAANPFHNNEHREEKAEHGGVLGNGLAQLISEEIEVRDNNSLEQRRCPGSWDAARHTFAVLAAIFADVIV